MVMRRLARSDAQLMRISEHLNYELWMLQSVSTALAGGIAQNGWLANALLESFIIHVRALLEFLYSETPREDDVVAADYFPNAEMWDQCRPPMSQTLLRAKRRVGKEVAHLSYARLGVAPEEKQWPFLEIANDVNAAMRVFIENVPKDVISPSLGVSLSGQRARS